MTYRELIDELSARTGVSARTTRKTLDLAFALSIERVKIGDSVSMGAFGAMKSGGRRGRFYPAVVGDTGSMTWRPPEIVLKFKASRRVNGYLAGGQKINKIHAGLVL